MTYAVALPVDPVSDALRISETRYRRLFETARDGILLLNAETAQIEDVNPYLIEMLGYSHAEFLGKKLWEVGSFADCAQSKEMFAILQDTGYVRYDDLPLKTKGGSPVAVEFVSNSYDCEGVKVIQCNIRSISERKASDAALRQAQHLGGIGGWEWEVGADITRWSAQLYEIMGFDSSLPPPQYADQKKIYAPASWLRLQEAVTRCLHEGKPYQLDLQYVRADGVEGWLEARGEAVRGDRGKVVKLIGTVQEITARHQAEAALRVSALALKSISQGVLITDANRRIISANVAFTNITGYDEHDILGRDCKFLQGPLTDAETVATISRTLHAEHEFDGEILNYRKDGTTFLNAMTISPVRDAAGIVVHYVGITRDITERRRARVEHEALEEQLRESQKMQAIGTLAGGIAHDFNNILAAIQGNTALALEDSASNPRVIESLAEIQKATTRARDLVQQILSFSRRQPTTLATISLLPVVEESARLLRSTLPARLALRMELAAQLPNVVADATQIEQVLLNLCTNAMHAMHDGTGRIDILLDTVLLDQAYAAAHPQAQAMLAVRPGLAVRLAVRDNGPGMDAATRARVFEPFFTTKPVGEGTGLGLSVVHAHCAKTRRRNFSGKRVGRRHDLYPTVACGRR